MSITLQFVLGETFSSRAIAWFSSGHFSHVDAVLPDGKLLGARYDRPGGTPSGVQIRPAGYERFASYTRFEIPATPPQERAFYQYLYDQRGKPYDSLAIWGFMFDRNWRDEDSWICSELQAAALEDAGILPQLYLAANKITPVALALVVSAIGAKVLP